jgi:nucleotide-binding universal stress UspA family protein
MSFVEGTSRARNASRPAPKPTGVPRVPVLVVGHSRDPASQEALRVARDLARRLGACLHIVHGITLSDYPVDPDAADWDEEAERTLAQQRKQVQTALATFRQGWTYSVTRRDPVSLISAAAEESDALMIIVGTRGGGIGPTIERLFGGSVSHGLIRSQHRPVLVVSAPRSCWSDARKANGAARKIRLRHGHMCSDRTTTTTVAEGGILWLRS